MKTRKQIDRMIDRYLARRMPNEDGRYAKVTEADLGLLHEIVYALLSRKYESDGEGDLPVELQLIDRSQYERAIELRIPYIHRAESQAERLEIISRLATNAKVAADRLQTAVTWDMAMAIIERAKRDTRETSAPYTEDELLGILEGLNGEIAKYSRKGGRDIHHEHEDLQRIPVQESGNHDHPAAAPAAAGPGGEPHHVREEDPGGGDR